MKQVIFVGDKGIIKSTQIETPRSDFYQWVYLTSITKEQIETLLKRDVIQIELFDNELIEVEDEGLRNFLRRNAARQEEIGQNRASRMEKIKNLAAEKTRYLSQDPHPKAEFALRKVNEKIAAYN